MNKMCLISFFVTLLVCSISEGSSFLICDADTLKDSHILFHDRWEPPGDGKFHNTSLIVDPDNHIRLVTFDEPEPSECWNEIMGVAINRSGKLNLSELLPQNEVAFAAHQFSIDKGVKLHLVLSWGEMTEAISSVDPHYYLSAVVFYLCIFREEEGDAELVYKHHQGTKFRDLLFEDINLDRRLEMVLTGESFPRGHWMRIWTVEQDGSVHKLKFDGENHSPSLVERVSGKPREIVTRGSENLGDRIVRTDYYYEWNAKRNAYVRTRSTSWIESPVN